MALDKRLSPKDRLGMQIDEMLATLRSKRRKFEQRWYDNNFFDDGYHFRYVSRTTGKVLDVSNANTGDPVRAIPKASRQIRGIANLIMGTDPVPVVYPDIAKGMEPELIEKRKQWAKASGLWIEKEWKDKDMKGKLTQMLILSMKHGISFLQVYPDYVEEKINMKVYDAFDIYIDGSQTDTKESLCVYHLSDVLPGRYVSHGSDTMSQSSVNHAWQFECILENGKQLKSWFYSDTEQDAIHRIKEYMGAKLISIKEIDDPLDLRKKQAKSDRIKETLSKKKQEEFEQRHFEKTQSIR